MVGAVVADVSFISLTQALPAALSLAAAGAWLIALVKPQFEAGRKAVGKGGIVRSEAEREKAVTRVWEFVESAGWRVLGVIPSPILGRGGNQEFLLGARHDELRSWRSRSPGSAPAATAWPKSPALRSTFHSRFRARGP